MSRQTTWKHLFGEVLDKVKSELRTTPPATTPSVESKAAIAAPSHDRWRPDRRNRSSTFRPKTAATACREKERQERQRRLAPQAIEGAATSLDLDVYRGNGNRPGTSVGRPAQTSLKDLTADMRLLRIAAASSHARKIDTIEGFEEGRSEWAILGLDFGTAFTKAVVRFDRRHVAVDWSDAVEGAAPQLLPSLFSEGPDGRIVLGRREEPGWERRDGIKMRLLSDDAANDIDAQCDAILFVAAAFRHVRHWSRRELGPRIDDARWRLHLGLPAESCAGSVKTIFQRIAEAAKSLACSRKPLTRSSAAYALGAPDPSAVNSIAILPEFACQLYSYVSAGERTDVHALVDIGAGTLDVAFFNVHTNEQGDVLPIFSAVVRNLGTHFLIGALAGKRGQTRAWQDRDCDATDEAVAKRLGESPDEVHIRRKAYRNSMVASFNEAREIALRRSGNSRVWLGDKPLELFLCGGGSQVEGIRRHVEDIRQDLARSYGTSLRVIPLPMPSNLLGTTADQYHRIAVAYGLSQPPGNVGDTYYLDKDVAPRTVPEREDRDATR